LAIAFILYTLVEANQRDPPEKSCMRKDPEHRLEI
jgi:hypothetical protein